MSAVTSLVWLRQDLRLADNPALSNAAQQGKVLLVYLMDDTSPNHRLPGGASLWWLQQGLLALSQQCNHKLLVQRGDPSVLLPAIAKTYGCQQVVWNRCYQPWQIQRDTLLKQQLTNSGFQVQSFNGSLLWEPWQVLKQDQTPYRVFTPFYQKGCLSKEEPRSPLPPPDSQALLAPDQPPFNVGDIQLDADKKWNQHWPELWQVSEAGAHSQLKQFLEQRLSHYQHNRDVPSVQGTSKLSPYLRWGQLSPNQIWHSAKGVAAAADGKGLSKFLAELGWREFSYYLLYHFPHITQQSFNPKFNDFTWLSVPEVIKTWQQGQTGIPIVDAGMRELWQTGYMHNRVRMIVASLLVKNLRQHWHHGAAWFEDCLLDADLASNSASWQWVAGCGADAAPYFRIFNPVLQGEKFDPEGEYVKTYCPELARLPNKYIHAPWQAPQHILDAAGIKLGQHYPEPIVDLKSSRQQALDAYSQLA